MQTFITNPVQEEGPGWLRSAVEKAARFDLVMGDVTSNVEAGPAEVSSGRSITWRLTRVGAAGGNEQRAPR